METVYRLNCLTSQIGGRHRDRCLQPLEHSPRSRKVFSVVLQDFADQFLALRLIAGFCGFDECGHCPLPPNSVLPAGHPPRTCQARTAFPPAARFSSALFLECLSLPPTLMQHQVRDLALLVLEELNFCVHDFWEKHRL